MKQLNTYRIWIFAFLGVAAITALIYLVRSYQGPKSSEQKDGQTAMSSREASSFLSPLVSSAKPSSNLVVYTNNVSGYTVEIPADWRVDINKEGRDLHWYDPNYHADDGDLHSTDPNDFRIVDYTDFADYFTYDQQENSSRATSFDEFIANNSTYQNVKVTNRKEDREYDVELVRGLQHSYGVFIEHSGHIFLLRFLNQPSLGSLTVTQREILSSFTFTGQ